MFFRLTGTRSEFGDVHTEHQRKLAETFASFAEHPAVKMARSFDGSNGVAVSYDAVAKFSVHVEKRGGEYAFAGNMDSLFDDGRWNETATKGFLPLFNDFYKDVNYGDFHDANIPYYEEITREFIDRSYSSIDFEWFGKYVAPSNLRCILTPSTSSNFGVTASDGTIYGFVANGTFGGSEICIMPMQPPPPCQEFR